MGENNIPSGNAVILNGEKLAESNIQFQQNILNNLAQLALKSKDSPSFIEDMIKLLKPVLQIDLFALYEKLSDGSLLLKAGWGWKEGLVGYTKLDGRQSSQAGFTLFNGESNGFETRFSAPPLFEAHQIKDGITAVVPGNMEPYGVIGLYTRNSQRGFSPLDLIFLRKIANKVGLALDRHRVESSLFAAQDERLVIFDSISDAIVIQDLNGQFLYANQVAAELLGMPDSDTLLSMDIRDVMKKYMLYDEHGEPFQMDRLPGRRALKGEKRAKAFVHSVEVGTDTHRWLEVKASPVMDQFQQVKYAVNVFQDITEIKQAEQDHAFLSELSSLIAKPLDYRALLHQISEMIIAHLADWCVVHVISEDETMIEQVATTHKDPEKRTLAQNLQEKFPPKPDFTRGAYKVLRTGEPEFFPHVTDEDIQQISSCEEHAHLMRCLGFRSAMVLPMIARGHSLGAISFVWGGPNGLYGKRQLFLAEEVTRRAALALDNVRLFQQAQNLNTELDTKVKRRTAMLERAVEKLNNEITERKIIEEDLTRSRALFSDLFDLSPDAMFLVNQDGEILRANVQGETIFGYGQNELVGARIEMLLSEQFREIHFSHRENYHTDPHRRIMAPNMDLFARKKSGDEFPVDVMLSPVKIGDEWLVISAVRDMTEQKRIQDELSEVQHRLIDSQESERLMLAQELHDGIIQELFSINFQLSEIEKDLEQAGLKEISQKIHTSSEMTQQVVQGLRGISRNLRPPALTPFGLEQAIYSHMEYFQEMHPELNIHLNLTPDGDMLADHQRLVLFRIYQNGVSNVARHAEAQNMWVTLDFDEDRIILEMKDDGKGLEMPIRWIKLAREGHLGLVGTRERVEAIGGKLVIESSLGKGTLIRVLVPLPKK
ncbi:MAG: hypothetical protein CL609_14650 [Anaerolineaceae bacterium]|nr:hypothetical protein [Anaerolineaceae bacterium]